MLSFTSVLLGFCGAAASMAERAGFEPARRLASRRPPGSNRAPCQARSPLLGGSGGIRTHTVTGFESDASASWATEPGWCRRWESNPQRPGSRPGASASLGYIGEWCPSSDSNREPPASETGASAMFGLEGRLEFGGSGGNRTLGAPKRNGSTVRSVSIAGYAPFGKEPKTDKWRRVKESNPRRGSPGAPVFGTGCRTIAAAPSGYSPECKKPPRLITGGLLAQQSDCFSVYTSIPLAVASDR